MIPYARQAGAVVLLTALVGSHWWAYTRGAAGVQAKFDTYVTGAERAAVRQSDANNGRGRKADEKNAVQTVYRDRYITHTVKEIERVTESLASCPVPADAVRLFNDAARCAREDRPAACGADDAMPGAG